MATCPECGAEVGAAKFCTRCGAAIDGALAETLAGPPRLEHLPPPRQAGLPPYIPPVPQIPPVMPAPPTIAHRNRWILPAAVILVLALVAGVVTAVLLGQRSTASAPAATPQSTVTVTALATVTSGPAAGNVQVTLGGGCAQFELPASYVPQGDGYGLLAEGVHVAVTDAPSSPGVIGKTALAPAQAAFVAAGGTVTYRYPGIKEYVLSGIRADGTGYYEYRHFGTAERGFTFTWPHVGMKDVEGAVTQAYNSFKTSC